MQRQLALQLGAGMSVLERARGRGFVLAPFMLGGGWPRRCGRLSKVGAAFDGAGKSGGNY